MSVGDPIQTLAERISTPKGCKKGLEPSWIRFGIIGPPISGSRSDMINYLSELAVRYSRPSALRSRQAPALSIALFLILFAILVLGPAKTAIDTKWAIPTAMSFIRGNMGDISEFVDPNDLSGITTFGERRYNYWPMGAALLAVPIVAAINLFDPNFEDEIKSFKGPGNKIIGSVFGAITGTVFFWMIYAQFANVPIAILSTLVLMFCTSIWSIATRALWSQGPMVLTVVIAMLLLLRARTRPSLAQYVESATGCGFRHSSNRCRTDRDIQPLCPARISRLFHQIYCLGSFYCRALDRIQSLQLRNAASCILFSARTARLANLVGVRGSTH